MTSRTSRFVRATRLLAVCVALAVTMPVVVLPVVDTIVLVASRTDGDRVGASTVAVIKVEEPVVAAAIPDEPWTEFLEVDWVPKHPRFLLHRSLLC